MRSCISWDRGIDMGWSEERVELLKKLWIEGLSASQIATWLGGDVTRNAVIGKVHRLQLRPRENSNQGKTYKQWKPRVVRPPRQLMAPVFRAQREEVREEPGMATVLTLGAHMCRWPIGDPGSDSFTFCGRSLNHKGPYCGRHAVGAYQHEKKPNRRGAEDELLRSLRRYI